MAGVAQKKQSFFNPVNSPEEKTTLVNSLVKNGIQLQIKVEGTQAESENDLTIVKTVSVKAGGQILGKYVSGPTLSPSKKVVVMFEISKSMYFCAGSLDSVNDSQYTLNLPQIFELQRRNSYRVRVPSNSSANFKLMTLNGSPLHKEFRVVDLSANGMGLAIPDGGSGLFKTGMTIQGELTVGTHAPMDIKADVKYLRKVTTEKPNYFHLGCSFLEFTASQSQQVTFLVNDCHRISFSRIVK